MMMMGNREPQYEDCVIYLAKALNITEKKLVEVLMDSLENENDTCDYILDELYAEFVL